MADKKDEKGKGKDDKDKKGGEDETPKLTIRGKEYTAPQIEQALAYAATKLQEASAQLQAAAAPELKDGDKPPKKVVPAKDKVALDDMTGGELAEHLMGEVREVVKPIAERVQVESGERVKDQARTQIAEAAKANPDFWDWQAEIRTVLQKYPDLSVPEALILARSSDPEKATNLGKKERETKDEEVKAKEPQLSGLLPTSGKTSRNTHMTVQDAANSAWEEVGMERHSAQIAEN